MRALSRREFIRLAGQGLLAGSGILGVGILIRFLGYQAEPTQPAEFDLGSASDFPLGSRTNFPDIPALLVHTENGFMALSLICTHLGCTLEQKADLYSCPCHGSRFDESGKVLQGPATKGLTVLRVEVNALGHLILFV